MLRLLRFSCDALAFQLPTSCFHCCSASSPIFSSSVCPFFGSDGRNSERPRTGCCSICKDGKGRTPATLWLLRIVCDAVAFQLPTSCFRCCPGSSPIFSNSVCPFFDLSTLPFVCFSSACSSSVSSEKRSGNTDDCNKLHDCTLRALSVGCCGSHVFSGTANVSAAVQLRRHCSVLQQESTRAPFAATQVDARNTSIKFGKGVCKELPSLKL
mmetsp:Transcript_90804/g.174822  ORF Transcript_90804/g.174822 Transcript_90804/m.174822 type:complete len:212 (-) Transcript_90804:38-673(-)